MKKKLALMGTIWLWCLASALAQKPLGVPGNWVLQRNLSDEFKNGLNTSKWERDPADWGPWSWEPNRVKVRNGKLFLTIDWKKHTRNGTQLYFTSGMIRSKAEIKYGYFEIKMKGTPRHPGTCPAFWTYSIGQPAVVINGQTIKYNEIDFPEIQQRQRNVKLIDWNLIRADQNGKRTTRRITTGGGLGPSFDPRKKFHVYGCLWDKNRIEFYIDGVKVATADPTETQFQVLKQHLTISLGLREPFYKYDATGTRIPVPTNTRPSGFPTTMVVEYVRVWKRASTKSAELNDESTSVETENTLQAINTEEALPTQKLQIRFSNSDNSLTVQGKNETEVEIFDLSGQKVLSKRFNNHTTINLSNFHSGVYIVHAKDGEKQTSQKIVKQ